MTIYQWLESDGGPLLVLSRDTLGSWGGADGDPGPTMDWGDYGRACSIGGYIGLVPVGKVDGLVLGDLPAPTTFLPAHNLFLRWVAADTEEEIVAAAEQALAIGVAWEAPEDLEWNVEGPLILFDSAARGNDLAEDDRLTVDIDSGEYCVRVAYLECGDNCMILVQLKRL